MKAEELAKKMSVVFTERVRVELKSCRDMVATGRYPYTGWFGILSEADERIVDEMMQLTHITDISEKRLWQDKRRAKATGDAGEGNLSGT